MSDQDLQNKIIERIETKLDIKVSGVEYPKQGMSGKVIIIKTEDRDYAIKYGTEALKDKVALELISRSGINIPVPKVYASFKLDKIGVLVMERLNYPLLETASPTEISLYIPSILQNLRNLHEIRSEHPGEIDTIVHSSWPDVLLSRITGQDFKWEEISKREVLDRKLVMESLERLIHEIKNMTSNISSYSLLHTDFNQRNLFIDPDRKEIAGIVDWEEAMFGDPIYDLARVRMLLWHFDLPKQVVDQYYQLISLTDKEKELEKLYWTYLVVQYLAWYSEEFCDFNIQRIRLHLEYLREYYH